MLQRSQRNYLLHLANGISAPGLVQGIFQHEESVLILGLLILQEDPTNHTFPSIPTSSEKV